MNTTKISVLAMTPRKIFTPLISLGLQNSNIRLVNPVRDPSGLWIAKMQPEPSNSALINSEIVVGKDEMTSDVQYYYTDLSVTDVIVYINTGNLPLPTLKLSFDNISNANALVGNASVTANWNTFFSLPTNGTPFTSVAVEGNDVNLFGGAGINLKNNLFSGVALTSIVDYNGIIISGSDNCFTSCAKITNVDLPALASIGSFFFANCTLLVTINLPALTTMLGLGQFASCNAVIVFDLPSALNVGDNCFSVPALSSRAVTTFNLPSCVNLGSSVGSNNVFTNTIGETITLTVPTILMTCNGGLPDGDIQYLQANNTVTIIAV